MSIHKIVIIILATAFILGQIARIQLGNIAFTFFDSVVVLSSVLWLGKTIARKSFPVLSTSNKLVLGFLISGFIGLLFFIPHLSQSQFFTAILYPIRLLAYLLLYYQAKELPTKDWKFANSALLVVIVTIVALGFIQLLYYPSLKNLYYLGWDDHLYRMFSTFLDPNFAGAFFVVFCLFSLDTFFKTKGRYSKVVTLFISLLSFIAVFLTYSRTGFIMLVIGMSVYLLSYMRKRTVVGVIACCILILIVISNTKIEGLNPFRTASTHARLESAQNAMTIIEKYPLFGVGFNAFRYAQVGMGFRNEYTQFENHADAGTDDSYLFVLATTGVIGFMFFLTFLLTIFKKLQGDAKKNYFPARSLVASFVAVLIGTLFLNLLFYPMLIAWLAVQGGLIRYK